MLDQIEWLFFDVGSTLVDEQAVYEKRFCQIACQSGVPLSRVYEMALSFYRRNQKGDQETAKALRAALPEWQPTLEQPYAAAAACLAQLHQRYRIGVIANQQPGTAARLKAYGLLPWIDLIISSAEEGVAKPDPHIFMLALRRSGCLPEHAVMIGDRIDNDILPAKRLGMRTIWVKQGFGRYWQFTHPDEQPDRTVHSLDDLLAIL